MTKPKTMKKKTAKSPAKSPAKSQARPMPSWDNVQTKFTAEQAFGHDKVGDYFPLGRVVRLQHVGPYGFVEYVAPGETSRHRVYVGGRDIGVSRHSIDSAIISAIAFLTSVPSDHFEVNAAAACRVLQRQDI